jgi:hypothetical protein
MTDVTFLSALTRFVLFANPTARNAMRKRAIPTVLMACMPLCIASGATSDIATSADAVASAGTFGRITRGSRTFFEAKSPNADTYELKVRDASSERTIVTDTGGARTIASFMPSPDGTKIAVVMALNQSPSSSLVVYDAGAATSLAQPVIGAAVRIAGWSPDSRTLYFSHRQVPNTGEISLMAWNFTSAPTTVQAYRADIVSIAIRKTETFLLQQQKDSAFRVMAVRTGKPQRLATELVPMRADRTLMSMHPAQDGLYVLARDQTHTWLMRISAKTDGDIATGFTSKFVAQCRNCRSFPELRHKRIWDIPLPQDGAVKAVFSDPLTLGLSILLQNGSAKPVIFHYDPAVGRFIRKRKAHSM